MRQSKSITITTALAALVILAGISFSDASQSIIKHGVKGKYKHTLVKHKVKGKHQNASSLTLAKPEMEEERGGDPPNDSLWFRRHKDLTTGTIPDSLVISWHQVDQARAMSRNGRDGLLSTGDPLDTVASLGPTGQGGRTRALLVSSASSHTFFAGSVSGGLGRARTQAVIGRQ